jgi:organic hydroperoxide reductase OsmC/OhrA
MAEHRAIVEWERDDANFLDNRYSRAHRWRFDGGVTVPASASPHVVPLPLSDPAAVDPEEAFVASLSSCHMLWFLSLAAKQGFVVDGYHDEAVGRMGRDADGRMAMLEVVLRPAVRFAGRSPDATALERLHHAAHDECFIARSVKTAVRCEPAGSPVPVTAR